MITLIGQLLRAHLAAVMRRCFRKRAAGRLLKLHCYGRSGILLPGTRCRSNHMGLRCFSFTAWGGRFSRGGSVCCLADEPYHNERSFACVSVGRDVPAFTSILCHVLFIMSILQNG